MQGKLHKVHFVLWILWVGYAQLSQVFGQIFKEYQAAPFATLTYH